MMYSHYGMTALFVSRFLPVFRAVAPPMAGAMRIPPVRTAGVFVLASAIWYGAIAWIAFRVGDDWAVMQAAVRHFARRVGVVALVAAALFAIIVFIVVRRRAAERLAEVMAAEQTGELPVAVLDADHAGAEGRLRCSRTASRAPSCWSDSRSTSRSRTAHRRERSRRTAAISSDMAVWCTTKSVAAPSQLTPALLRDFVYHLKDIGLSPASIRRSVSATRTYFKFMIGEGQMVARSERAARDAEEVADAAGGALGR